MRENRHPIQQEVSCVGHCINEWSVHEDECRPPQKKSSGSSVAVLCQARWLLAHAILLAAARLVLR